MRVTRVMGLAACAVLVASQGVGQVEPSPREGEAVEAASRPRDEKVAPKPRGFTLASEDARFLMQISAALQLRYTYVDFDHRVVGNEADYSNFYLRRARLWFSGYAYDPKLTYLFHVQFEPSQAVNLHDAWVSYRFSDLLTLGAGRNKIPYGTEFLASGFSLDFVERSILTGETDISSGQYSNWPGGGAAAFMLSAENPFTGFPIGGLSLYRSQGVALSGRRVAAGGAAVEYEVGVWNGRNTKGLSNSSDDHLWSGRVHFYPFGPIDWTVQGDPEGAAHPRVGIIGSAYRSESLHTRDAAGQLVPVYAGQDRGWDASALLRYAGLAMDLEWSKETYEIKREIPGPTVFDRNGWRASLGYFVVPKRMEITVRHARVRRLEDPSPAAVTNSGLGFVRVEVDGLSVQAIEKELTESTVGFNLYLDGHKYKLFFDVSQLTREFVPHPDVTPADQEDLRFRSMFQLKF